MLCLNSEEAFKETLAFSQQEYSDNYYAKDRIECLRFNTGDWEYHCFYELEEGFDENLYDEHYYIPFDYDDEDEGLELDDEQLEKLLNNSPYHKAMSELLDRLLASGVFEHLKRSDDFRVFLSEHD